MRNGFIYKEPRLRDMEFKDNAKEADPKNGRRRMVVLNASSYTTALPDADNHTRFEFPEFTKTATDFNKFTYENWQPIATLAFRSERKLLESAGFLVAEIFINDTVLPKEWISAVYLDPKRDAKGLKKLFTHFQRRPDERIDSDQIWRVTDVDHAGVKRESGELFCQDRGPPSTLLVGDEDHAIRYRWPLLRDKSDLRRLIPALRLHRNGQSKYPNGMKFSPYFSMEIGSEETPLWVLDGSQRFVFLDSKETEHLA
eukprot:IDg4678t1